MKKVNVLKFKEHDLEIKGEASTIREFVTTIREFVTTIRELQTEANADLPTTINDILFQMEVVLNIDGLGEDNEEDSQELSELLTIDSLDDIPENYSKKVLELYTYALELDAKYFENIGGITFGSTYNFIRELEKESEKELTLEELRGIFFENAFYQ